MPPNDFKQKIARMAVQIKQAVDADLPKIIGNKATGMFKQNFQHEGFFGQKWKEVKRRQHPPKHSRYPADARRKILTGRTANLGRSIRYTTGRGVAVVYSDAPYSQYHNEGTSRLPQRQFLGNHKKIEQMAKAEIERRIGNILNK